VVEKKTRDMRDNGCLASTADAQVADADHRLTEPALT